MTQTPDTTATPALFIDADACPVRADAIDVAERYGVRVFIVSNGGIRPVRHPLVEMAYVPDGPDAADDWIAERIGPGDVCVTADILLADRCVKKEAEVVRPDGRPLTSATIGQAVAMRNLMSDLRETGAVSGYNAAFSARDRSRFRETLDGLLRP